MKRTITINESPRIELALRELENGVNNVEAVAVETEEVVVNTSSNHNMGDEDAVNVDTTLGNRTVYLSPTVSNGKRYKVSNRGTGTVTVNGVGRNINGDPTLIISFENSTAQLQFSGTEWVVI